MLLCLDKIVITSLWNKIWAQNLYMIIKGVECVKHEEGTGYLKCKEKSMSRLTGRENEKCSPIAYTRSPWKFRNPLTSKIVRSRNKAYSTVNISRKKVQPP